LGDTGSIDRFHTAGRPVNRHLDGSPVFSKGDDYIYERIVAPAKVGPHDVRARHLPPSGHDGRRRSDESTGRYDIVELARLHAVLPRAGCLCMRASGEPEAHGDDEEFVHGGTLAQAQ
jgi:hypothetical protein